MMIESHMARERVSVDELHRALLQHGIQRLDQTALAELERGWFDLVFEV
jgi:uncharacterized membrane protein YcaP (DUF421 family)